MNGVPTKKYFLDHLIKLLSCYDLSGGSIGEEVQLKKL